MSSRLSWVLRCDTSLTMVHLACWTLPACLQSIRRGTCDREVDEGVSPGQMTRRWPWPDWIVGQYDARPAEHPRSVLAGDGEEVELNPTHPALPAPLVWLSAAPDASSDRLKALPNVLRLVWTARLAVRLYEFLGREACAAYERRLLDHGDRILLWKLHLPLEFAKDWQVCAGLPYA